MRAALGALTPERAFWLPRHFSAVRSTAQGDAGRLCRAAGSERSVDQGQMAAGAAGEAATRGLQPPPPHPEPASLRGCTPTKKVTPQEKKRKATRSTAERARTALSGSIWTRLDPGCPGQLLQQTEIPLPLASARGRAGRQLPALDATQDQERALLSLPAPACRQGGLSPLHSTSRAHLPRITPLPSVPGALESLAPPTTGLKSSESVAFNPSAAIHRSCLLAAPGFGAEAFVGPSETSSCPSAAAAAKRDARA